jgi:hypothetical protein
MPSHADVFSILNKKLQLPICGSVLFLNLSGYGNTGDCASHVRELFPFGD